MNFYSIEKVTNKDGSIELYPDFHTDDENSDLMVRGKQFYAIWDAEARIWSTNEYSVRKIVDRELMRQRTELENKGIGPVKIRKMSSYQNKVWSTYKNYISQQPDRFVALDDKLTFADTEVKREDYVSHRLKYSLAPADHQAYDELMGLLYLPEEQEKIEWAIGSILSGDSRKIEKFYVLYGKGGTGKGTVLKIIGQLFEGYTAAFVAKDLAQNSKDFSMESFRTNPLVAIDEDGDLSKVEDATRINSIVSHERVLMNEKGKPHYPYIPHCVLFIGSNDPVKIKDEESGLIRRLIDIEPKSKKAYPVPGAKHAALMSRIQFELGGIAYHCLEVYKRLGQNYYDHYRPKGMISKTNAFYNFMKDSCDAFMLEDGISLKNAYDMWKNYCDEAGLDYKAMPRLKFGSELINYFNEFYEVTRVDGKQVRSWYTGFKAEMFDWYGGEASRLKQKIDEKASTASAEEHGWLKMDKTVSLLDDVLKDCKAQYDEHMIPWDSVKTRLRDLDTSKTHMLIPPDWVLMMDFDLKNEAGEKDRQKNLDAANQWPPTYAEFSKSGAGIHLYYRFSGDLAALESLFAKDIEVKVYTGKAAIRRKVSLCNDLPIATLSSGLPVKAKKEKKNQMVDIAVVELERYLTNCILKALQKKIPNCPSTKSSCDYIKYILDEAYGSGKHYDVSTLRSKVYGFAMGSSNNKRYCTDLVRKMRWFSQDVSKPSDAPNKGTMAIFDIEVFPNVNMVNWKIIGYGHPVMRLINPKPTDIEELLRYDLVGFNCRKYDNHILHAMRLGYLPPQVYERSKLLIDHDGDGYFREAWDYSKVDIYDMSSEKRSLKWFEIQLGREMEIRMHYAFMLKEQGMDIPAIAQDKRVGLPEDELREYMEGSRDWHVHHLELGMKWDEPVPEEEWDRVAAYCDNDVLATEALWLSKPRQADWTARQGLANLTGMSTNSTTNNLTSALIFGKEKNPQREFNYRFMGTVPGEVETYCFGPEELGLDNEYTLFNAKGQPVFPGYEYKKVTVDEKGEELKKPYWVSIYRGEEVGEGGYVYAEKGYYSNVALLDIASMHPSSIRAENLFGDRYTRIFGELVDARLAIKHKQYDRAAELFGGKLKSYLGDPKQAKALAAALKIAINSVYGLTSAKFDNPFRDKRNIDNIVAKRGALFMINLKHEVQRRGFTVAHIKTDSIKIPDATPEIIKFVMDYGKLYGYNFEHEATYERMCLITKADYVAKYDTKEAAMAKYGYIPSDLYDHGGEWTETGDWFKDPYTFKTLFTHEPIWLEDMFEVNSVTTAMYLDMNENLSKGDHNYIFVGRCGAFCPVLPGCNGGELVRENKTKYDSVQNSKDCRWKEYEVIRDNHLEHEVDRGYYEKRAAEARAEIEKYIPFDLFVSDMPLPPKKVELPWD